MKAKTILFAAAAAVCLLFTSCTQKLPKHVVLIGVDGWSVAEFADVNMTFCRSLQQNGSWTFNKRTVIPTASGINWETICTGTPPEYHGFTNWDSITASFDQLTATDRDTIPTIFRLYREKHPEANMLLTYNWDAIPFLADSTVFDTVRGNACTREAEEDDVAFFDKYFKENKPELSFIYLGAQDEIGHEYGWKSDEYRAAMVSLDKLIEKIVTTVREAGLEEETVFILTTDHGGWNKSHGEQYVNDVMKTPFFIFGKGIVKGLEIKAPMSQTCITPTLARVLGIEPLDNWTGVAPEEAFK